MRPRKSINQINVVPYIDVMLVLLVIFMVTAPLVAPGAIELPTVGASSVPPAAPLIVRIYKDGRLTLRDQQANSREQTVTRDQLLVRIRSKQQNGRAPQAVVIEADKGVLYDVVVGVLDELKRSRVEKVGLLVKPAT